MVYPHLDSKEAYPQTASWQSGNLTRPGWRRFLKGGPEPDLLFWNASRFRHPSIDGRPPRTTGIEPSKYSWKTAAGFSTHLTRGWPFSISSATRKGTESSSWGPRPRRRWIEEKSAKLRSLNLIEATSNSFFDV